MSEMELRDAILRHALQLQRLSAGHEKETARILRELEQELRALLNSQSLSQASKAEIEKLVNQSEDIINPAYADMAATVDTHALAVVVAERTAQAMETVFPSVSAVTAERLASLTTDTMVYGAPSSAWWEKQAEDTAFKFAAQVRQGVINGETNESIVARIVGRGAEPGILDVSRRNARALVHSSVMSAANEARLATFRKNASLIDGVRWLSTLDSHTCVVCGALDGQSWDLEGRPLDGTDLEFQSPPQHWNCRCVLSPIPKAIEGLELPEGQRASSEGPASASTTFEDFLKRQSPAFIENTLGKRRAELFTEGRLTLTDLVSGTGRELTLSEL